MAAGFLLLTSRLRRSATGRLRYKELFNLALELTDTTKLLVHGSSSGSSGRRCAGKRLLGRAANVLEQRADGSFQVPAARLVPGEPLETSYGKDLYREIFA